MDHPGLFYLEQDLRRSLRKAWYQTARYLEQHPEEDAGQVWARVLERNVHAFAYQLPMNLYDWGITEGYSELSHAAEVSLRVSKTSSEDPIRKGKNYQMKKGDTLIGIARRYGITLEQLYEVNPGLKEQDPRKLAVGTVLTLPYGAPFRMKAQIEVFVPLHQDRILEAYYNLGLLRRLTGVKAPDLQYYRDPRSPSPLAPRSSFGNHPPTDDQPPDSWDKWNRRDTPSHAPWERNSHHGKGPGPWIEGYEQGGNRLDDNPAYPHYLMSAYDLRRKGTVQVQPYRKPPLKLSPHVNEPNQAFQLAPLIPALEEVSGKVIGRSLLAGAGWILTLLCLSGDTRREPLEMLPRGEDWPGPISASVYDQLSAEEAQRYNELRYKKAAGKASEQESRDFQELEEKLVEDGSLLNGEKVVEEYPLQTVEERAKDIHAALPEATQRRTTTAVGEVMNPDGTKVILVGTSEQRLRPAQRQVLKPNEIEVKGLGHAEQTILNYAKEHDQQVITIGASRPICLNCEKAIREAGATPIGTLKGKP